MTEKLYTEKQVERLLAMSILKQHDSIQTNLVSDWEAKLREMLMEVAIKTAIRIVGEFRTDSAIAKSLNTIVNEILGETS